MKVSLTILILCTNSLIFGLPVAEKNYASQASRIIATNLLKEYAKNNTNNVFSPLGITGIINILAEAATGDSYKEFRSSFGFPESKEDLRESFKIVLENFDAKKIGGKDPSLKTWFYIYRNNTSKKDFKNILRKYYFADVKDIERNYYDHDEHEITTISTPIENNSKDIIGFESLKKSENFPAKYDNPIKQKDASKFDQIVDDKQYVEVPIIKNEIEKDKNELDTILHDTDNEAQSEQVESIEQVQRESVNEPGKVKIPLKNLIDPSALEELENYFLRRRLSPGRSLFERDDIAAALTATSLITGEESMKTRYLLFNGFYYRGKWNFSFYKSANNTETLFYINQEKSIPVEMMKSKGYFRTAEIENLNSRIIELPYENTRYSMIIVSPKEDTNIEDVIQKLNPDYLQGLPQHLKSKLMDLWLPKINFGRTSRTINTLKNLGLTKIFMKGEAGLSDLTDDRFLHIDDIAQHVNIRMDESGVQGLQGPQPPVSESKNSNSSASSIKLPSTSTTQNIDNNSENIKYILNRPFLYFIMDKENDFVIVSGKVISPEFQNDDLL